MGEWFELRGRERKALREAIRTTEDALLEIDPAASGERTATPEALARALRAVLAGQAAVLKALLGAAGPAADRRGEKAPGEATLASDDSEALPGPGSEKRGARGSRGASFAQRIGQGDRDEDDGGGDERPAARLRPLTLDDSDDDLSEVLAAEPLCGPKSDTTAFADSTSAAASSTSASLPGADPAAGDRSSRSAANHSAENASGAASGLAAMAVRAFPLDEINRWLASGTVFQIRGALAFLNMGSMGGTRIVEMSGHIRRMGFADELGPLVVEGLDGPILLFGRPAGE